MSVRIRACVLIIGALAIVFARHAFADEGGCTCASARLNHTWCEACHVGYVCGVPVKSADLFEAIHPHGHDVFMERTRCDSCKRAIASDGFCTECNAGYLKSQAYFSKLAYILAQGETVDPATLECAACRHATESTGWCDRCALGWWGNVKYSDRQKFAIAEHQNEILHAAIKVADRCGFCAMALIVDSRCHKCRISYADGKAQGSKTEVLARPK